MCWGGGWWGTLEKHGGSGNDTKTGRIISELIGRSPSSSSKTKQDINSQTNAGCRDGSVGRVIAFTTPGPKFESKNLYKNLGTVLCASNSSLRKEVTGVFLTSPHRSRPVGDPVSKGKVEGPVCSPEACSISRAKGLRL